MTSLFDKFLLMKCYIFVLELLSYHFPGLRDQNTVVVLPIERGHGVILSIFAISMIFFTLKRRGLKGPSQPHLCFCLHAKIWLLYFIRSLSKRRKITVKLLKIIKHTFWNTAYSKTIRIHFTMLYQ